MSDRPAFKPNITNVMSNWVYGVPVAGAQKRPNLQVKVFNNVPRIVVKTNVPDDRNNGRIDFNVDLSTFTVAMKMLRELAEGKREGKIEIDFIDDFVAGKKLDKKIKLATLRFDVERESGKLFIAVLANNRPKIQFFFGPSQFHAISVNGEPMSEADLSRQYAYGFAHQWETLVSHLLISEFNPDAKNVAKMPGTFNQGGGQQQNRNQGGGGGYQQNNNGGGGQSKAKSFDAEFGDDGIEDW